MDTNEQQSIGAEATVPGHSAGSTTLGTIVVQGGPLQLVIAVLQVSVFSLQSDLWKKRYSGLQLKWNEKYTWTFNLPWWKSVMWVFRVLGLKIWKKGVSEIELFLELPEKSGDLSSSFNRSTFHHLHVKSVKKIYLSWGTNFGLNV